MKYEDFHVALITALPIELACVKSIFDETYEDLPRQKRDENTYIYGRVGKHDVVLASLPSGVTANTSAATVAGRVWRSFPNLEFGLMIGVGGGVPSMEHGNSQDVRLGDVVVSKPTDTFGGVVKFDLGKTVPGGQPSRGSGKESDAEFVRTGMLNRPPDILLTAVSKLQAKHMLEESETPQYLRKLLEKYPRMGHAFTYPGSERDILFEAAYDHPGKEPNCANCDSKRRVQRAPRAQQEPMVHYGTILTGDVVMRRGLTREKLAKDFHALCIEMEAAGISSTFPCLVIRGICDYADSHKNKEWQPYAAAVAAAYAKELLDAIPPAQIEDKAQTYLVQASQFGSSPSWQINGGINSTGGRQHIGGTYNGPVYFNG